VGQEYRDILIADTFVDLTRLKLRAQQVRPSPSQARTELLFARLPAGVAVSGGAGSPTARPSPLQTPETEHLVFSSNNAGRPAGDQRRGLEVPARRVPGTDNLSGLCCAMHICGDATLQSEIASARRQPDKSEEVSMTKNLSNNYHEMAAAVDSNKVPLYSAGMFLVLPPPRVSGSSLDAICTVSARRGTAPPRRCSRA